MRKFSCLKAFKTPGQLYATTHTGEKLFKCNHCPKAFLQLVNLRHHILIHTGERPYACPSCPKRFRQKSALDQHLRIHLNIKPYKCLVCRKDFRQASNLRNHTIKVHHRQEGSPARTMRTVKPQNHDHREISIRKEDGNKRINKLNFTPSSWWIQCRICKVCIQDEDKFIAHILSKHPSWSSSSSTAFSNGDSENDEPSETSHAVGLTDGSENYSEDEDFRVKQSTNVIKAEPSALCGTVLGNVPEHKESLLKEWTSRVFEDESVLAVDIVAIEIVDRTATDRHCADEAMNEGPILRPAGSSCTANTVTNLLGDDMVPPLANSIDRMTEEHVKEQPEGTLLAESSPITPDFTAHPQNIGTLENTPVLQNKLHKCCICLKEFSFRANLNCHLSVAHLSKSGPKGERVLKCGICPKTFSNRKHLSHHSWIHTEKDEHRFKCPTCMTGFTRKSLFKTHSKHCRKTQQK